MSITFIHAADLHLDRPFKGLSSLPQALKARVRESTFTALDRLVETAREQSVDFVILAGDIFDEANRSLRAQLHLKRACQSLEEQNIEVFMSHGNHDPLNGEWHEITYGENVHVFGSAPEVLGFNRPGKPKVNLYGFSYETRHITESMLSLYQRKSNADFHIGLLHGSIKGNTDHDVYAPFTVQELLEKDFDYWALGHIHQRLALQQEPPIHYPGSLQGLSAKETGDKGFYLVQLEEQGSEMTFISAADIIWQHLELSMGEVETMDHLVTKLKEVKEKSRLHSQGVLLRLQLKKSNHLKALLEEEFVEELLEVLREGEEERRDFVWPYTIQSSLTQDYDYEQLRKESHFLGDLIRLSENIESVPSLDELYKHVRARQYLEPLRESDQRQLIKEAERLLIEVLHKEITS
ncbi:DNA repair exonuclease SbcCD nuclease subunit [Pullulanibacillus pueri]|uniref:DNA repair exonuclease n=1 Tax=Pullulanibacillus pueri TaxID=1437324 RepID=A0A8J3A0A7_9BACL|nr:DNA repair exonuclease [Pullulanibacillus pueri]MBM7683419.1 DNA repair exonuclease SbcCD nuclease subunit [Pullulanibacillus pueri]GGH88072.1 DNA repair exonuclease [Pullulanibacillus pueri]